MSVTKTKISALLKFVVCLEETEQKLNIVNRKISTLKVVGKNCFNYNAKEDSECQDRRQIAVLYRVDIL